MKVIAAGPEAAAVFAALHAAAFDVPWSPSAFHGTLLGLGAFGLVALRDDDPVGLLVGSAAGDSADVLTVGVAPPARRSGAGRALMAAAEREARARGVAAIVLEVAVDNAAARTLYAALGYEQVSVRRAYYGRGDEPRADALVLRKSIRP